MNSQVKLSLERFEAELRVFNQRLNLISRRDMENLQERHILDASSAFESAIEVGFDVDLLTYDFGSGNGIPGLVFALMNESLSVKLVERDLRKAEFLKHCIRVLGLFSRVEVIASDVRFLQPGSVDQVVCRGFSRVDGILELAKLVGTNQCQIFMMKGPNWEGEIRDGGSLCDFALINANRYREHGFLLKFARVPRGTD